MKSYKQGNELSRKHKSNPFANIPLSKRLENNNAVVLTDNSYIINHENGYDELRPLNYRKIMKGER